MSDKIYLSDVVGTDGNLYRPLFKELLEYEIFSEENINLKSVIFDNKNKCIYAVGSSYLYKFNLDTLEYENKYHEDISGTAIYYDDYYIYTSMKSNYIGEENSIGKFDKNTLEKEQDDEIVPSFGGKIVSIKGVSNKIYVAGYSNYLRIYKSQDLTLTQEVTLYTGDIYAMESDYDYIYLGGTNDSVRKYNKSDMTYVEQTPEFGENVQMIKVDSNYIYVQGISNYIKRYNISNMRLNGSIMTKQNYTKSLDVDNKYVYVCTSESASGNTSIEIYNKDNLKLVHTIQTTMSFSDTNIVCVNNGNIYLIGDSIIQYRNLNEIEGYIKIT